MWEQRFETYLGTLLQKPSNQLFTREKTERITNVLMNGKTDSARFWQYVKEKKLTLINCPEFDMENELCIPANEVRNVSFQFVLYKLYFYQLILPLLRLFTYSLNIKITVITPIFIL
jgi:hypothetical protein